MKGPSIIQILAATEEQQRLIDLAIDADRHAVRPLAYPGRTDLLVDGYGVTVDRTRHFPASD